MYRCIRCQRTYNYDELTRTQEYRGEYQGHPAFETVRSCPDCGDDVEYCGDREDDEYVPEDGEEE